MTLNDSIIDHPDRKPQQPAGLEPLGRDWSAGLLRLLAGGATLGIWAAIAVLIYSFV
ncbi:MAG: hypothetical protein AAFY01_06100 [Pseudomonadota bacterium]